MKHQAWAEELGCEVCCIDHEGLKVWWVFIGDRCGMW